MKRLIQAPLFGLMLFCLQSLFLSGCECDDPTEPPYQEPQYRIVATFRYSPADPLPEQILTVNAVGTRVVGSVLINTYTFRFYDGLEAIPANLLAETVVPESNPGNPSPPVVTLPLPEMEYGYVTVQLTVDGQNLSGNIQVQGIASTPILVAPCGTRPYPVEPPEFIPITSHSVHEYPDPVPLPPILLGAPLDLSLPIQGGVPPLSWNYVGHYEFPAGLSLTTDGRLVGTPTEILYPSLDFPFHITDACTYGDRTVLVKYIIEILPTGCFEPLVVTLDNQYGFVGADFNAEVEVEGGVPPYRFWLVEGELPPLISFTDGVFSGSTNYAGTFPFTIRVRDDCDNRQAVDTPFWIMISGSGGCPPLTASIGSPPPGSVGVPYLWSGAFQGGHHPVVFELSTGALPPGLTLDAEPNWQGNFDISGTPTTAGTFAFSMRATDNCLTGPQIVTENLEIVIEQNVTNCELMTVTSGNPPEGWRDQTYSFTFTVAGGEQPITFQELQGLVGLTLDTETGVLSGIPENPGTFTYRLVIYDSCTPEVQAIYPAYTLVIN